MSLCRVFSFFGLLPLYWKGYLGIDVTMTTFILGATKFPELVLMMGGGYLSDVFGRIKVFLIISFLSSVLMSPTGYLPFGPILIVSLLCFTFFYHPYFPVLFALISDGTRPSEQSKMIGIITGLGSIQGGGVILVITGFLADTFGFLVAWVFPAAINLLSCLLLIPIKNRK